MKKTVVVTSTEIQQAIIAMMLKRASLSHLFIGGVYLIADDSEPRNELKIRAEVVYFDTEKTAREFAQAPTPPAAAKAQEKKQ